MVSYVLSPLSKYQLLSTDSADREETDYLMAGPLLSYQALAQDTREIRTSRKVREKGIHYY